MIKDLVENSRLNNDEFLIINSVKGVTNTGDPYLKVTFQDASGQMEARKWKCNKEDELVLAVGNTVAVTGEVFDYQGTLQIKLLGAVKTERSIADAYKFVPNAPVERDLMIEELNGYINKITNKEIVEVVKEIIDPLFISFTMYPAASKNHHAYSSGLLHHTLTMLKTAESIANIYTNLDTNYLYAGIILHDVGKIEELSGPMSPTYTTKGKLIGHISIVHSKVVEACDKLKVSDEISTVLEHLVLAHHGEKEFGSPVLPSTMEALVVHFVDDLDAKLNLLTKTLDEIEEGEFSAKLGALDNRSFYKPHKTK